MLSTLLGTVQALPYYRLNVSVDDDAYSSNDGDGGDRHSWKNRIQLQKQSKEQSTKDTDTICLWWNSIHRLWPETLPPTLLMPSLFHHLLHRGVMDFGLTWLTLPCLIHLMLSEAQAECSIPRQIETWRREDGILAEFHSNMCRVLHNIFLGPATQ